MPALQRSEGTRPGSGGVPTETLASWHALPLHEVMQRLGSGAEGLSEEEATHRRARFGPNALEAAPTASVLRILLDQFRSVVVVLLLAAAALAALLRDPMEAGAILAVLVINAALGFTTELRARRAMAALLRLEVPRATVLRHGSPRDVDAHTLVPGDVIVLEAGRAVPADARLLEGAGVRTTEAPLTGESLPVDKDPGATLPEDTPLAERANLVFMATVVVAGAGRAVVVATGMSSEVGRIGRLVGEIHAERTPLERRLDALGRRLVWLTLAVAGVVVIEGLRRAEPLGRMLETGIALAIAAVPEGLAAVSTIALAVGVARMARRNALVRRLPAVESLGSATVVCADKTGTLTGGELTVTTVVAGGSEYAVTGRGYRVEGEFLHDGRPVDLADEPGLELVLRAGVLCNAAALSPGAGGAVEIRGDPTDAAILVAAAKGGLERAALLRRWPAEGELPFSSERMFMATAHRGPQGPVRYVKGAPARVVERCARVLGPHGPVALDPAGREQALGHNRALAGRGLRVLALALGEGDQLGDEDIAGLTLIGFVGMSDPTAEGVKETIARLQDAGIRTLMMTGDQRLTAQAVARELGILRNGDEVMEARALRELDADALAPRLARVAALSRMSPEQKLHVVEALQRRGEIVAMLGDGVNDAPALKKADVGVAMGGRGTDVAKEAAAVVLRDDRFPTIAAAVEEGRVIYANIRKFVFYLFSCNLAEVLVILGAGILGMPQPLLPIQILWLNLATDTFPALSLAVEPAEADVMRRPPREPGEAILSRAFLGEIPLFALLITTVVLTAFALALRGGGGEAHAVTVAFTTLALAQTFHLGNARGAGPVLGWRRATGNRWALAAVALTVSLQLLAVYAPPLARVLHVVPLGTRDWRVILSLALVPAIAGQAIAWLRPRPGAA